MSSISDPDETGKDVSGARQPAEQEALTCSCEPQEFGGCEARRRGTPDLCNAQPAGAEQALRQAAQDFLAEHSKHGPQRPAYVRRWLQARADALTPPGQRQAAERPTGGDA